MGPMVMSRARLGFVVVKLEGTVKRETCTWTKKDGLRRRLVAQPAGYLVYCPLGHVVRLKDESELAFYGVNKEAVLTSLEGLTDPNSPIGKLMLSQEKSEREGAMTSLKDMTMMLAVARSGPVVMPEQVRRFEVPKGMDAAA